MTPGSERRSNLRSSVMLLGFNGRSLRQALVYMQTRILRPAPISNWGLDGRRKITLLLLWPLGENTYR